MDSEVAFILKDRNKVTADSVVLFVETLVELDYIENDGIEWISYDHYDPEVQDRVGESFEPESIEAAKFIISEKGVEFICIGFEYKNHYGSGKCINEFSGLVEELNTLSVESASEQDSYITPDIYSSASFSNGKYHTEWGEMEICKLRFGGDGMPDDIDRFVCKFKELAESRQKYIQINEILAKCFHQSPEFSFEITGG